MVGGSVHKHSTDDVRGFLMRNDGISLGMFHINRLYIIQLAFKYSFVGKSAPSFLSRLTKKYTRTLGCEIHRDLS
jgi:hypothetical protein